MIPTMRMEDHLPRQAQRSQWPGRRKIPFSYMRKAFQTFIMQEDNERVEEGRSFRDLHEDIGRDLSKDFDCFARQTS